MRGLPVGGVETERVAHGGTVRAGVALHGDDTGEDAGLARVERAGDTVHRVERGVRERLDEDVDDPLTAQASAENDITLRSGVVTDDNGAAGGESFKGTFAGIVLQAAAADGAEEIRTDALGRRQHEHPRPGTAIGGAGGFDDRHQRRGAALRAGFNDGAEFFVGHEAEL